MARSRCPHERPFTRRRTTIGVTYMRMNPEGKTTGVTFATYEKMP